jgi:hypothetical protein
MKKSNYIRHQTLFNFIFIVFLASFLYPFPSEAATTLAFDVTNPSNNMYLNDKNVNFSGTYSIDSAATLSISIVVDNTNPSTPEDISNQIIKNPDTSTWSYNREFTEGPHTVTFTATDGTTTISKGVSFTIDTQRPVVSGYKLISANHVGNLNTWEDSIIEDMVHVPLDAKIQITVKDTNSITYKKASDGTYTNPITVISDTQTEVASVEDHQGPPQPDIIGNYVITFTPTKQLEPSTTYYVFLTSNVVDNSGNSVYPKIIKFTTTSQKDQSTGGDDPHGDYDVFDSNTGMNRTNLCANCHSTHMGGTVKLLGGNFIKDPTKNPTEVDNTTNYCMACHDGTAATRMATKVENMDLSTGSKHDEALDSKHLPNEGSCASCHDPHLIWSKDNPNSLQDHFVYDHTQVDPAKNAPKEIIDSDTILCESCHDLDTNTIKNETGVEYKISHYRKSTNRLGASAPAGILEDSDLCFRCHNPNKLPNSDVQTLYGDSNSMHNFSALDGSNVTGPLPCAECHETHGSNNIKLLKTKLGQENQQTDFTATTGDWSADKERDFCLKCHNGSTAVYGVTGKLPDPATPGHETSNTDACSRCHSNSYDVNDPMKGFMEAAHDPKAGITPTP